MYCFALSLLTVNEESLSFGQKKHCDVTIQHTDDDVIVLFCEKTLACDVIDHLCI